MYRLWVTVRGGVRREAVDAERLSGLRVGLLPLLLLLLELATAAAPRTGDESRTALDDMVVLERDEWPTRKQSAPPFYLSCFGPSATTATTRRVETRRTWSRTKSAPRRVTAEKYNGHALFGQRSQWAFALASRSCSFGANIEDRSPGAIGQGHKVNFKL